MPDSYSEKTEMPKDLEDFNKQIQTAWEAGTHNGQRMQASHQYKIIRDVAATHYMEGREEISKVLRGVAKNGISQAALREARPSAEQPF